MQSWLWFAWIVRPDGAMLPVYSLLAGTASPPSGPHTEEFSLASGSKLKIAQAVLDGPTAKPLWNLFDQDLRDLDLSQFIPGAPPMTFCFTRIVQTNPFGQGGVQTSANYAMPDPRDLFSTPADLTAVVNICTQQLGLSFREEFATHLGGFDIFQMKPWFESPAPYGMEVLKSAPQAYSDGVRIWRDNANKEEIAHLVLHSDGEIVFDAAVVLRPNEEFRDFAIITIPDSMDLRVFAPDTGELLFRQKAHFIREVAGNIMTPGPSLVLRDGLAKRASSHKALAARASTRLATRASRFSTGLDPSKLRAYTKTMHQLMDASAMSADRWFPHGIAGELEAIAYFNDLMGEANVQEAILVDPFFGADALERVLRLSNNHSFTCVASWADADPDTNRGTAAEALQRLEILLGRLGGQIVPRFRFINLVTGGGDRAFHDRYLLLGGDNMTARVFLLSNSMNGMSLNWPFCMSELHGDALLQATAYVRGLADGQEVTGAVSPQINFRWPVQTNPPPTA